MRNRFVSWTGAMGMALAFVALTALPMAGQAAKTAAQSALPRTPGKRVAPPNDAGVSLGHIHLTVPDPDAQIKVWVDVLGATASKAGPLNLVKLPGIFIIVTKANATEGSNGSTANHIGFHQLLRPLLRSFSETAL